MLMTEPLARDKLHAHAWLRSHLLFSVSHKLSTCRQDCQRLLQGQLLPLQTICTSISANPMELPLVL